MYPTIVIIVVESQRSIADVYSIHTADLRAHCHQSAMEHGRAATIGHLSFAAGRPSIDVRPNARVEHEICYSDSEDTVVAKAELR